MAELMHMHGGMDLISRINPRRLLGYEEVSTKSAMATNIGLCETIWRPKLHETWRRSMAGLEPGWSCRKR